MRSLISYAAALSVCSILVIAPGARADDLLAPVRAKIDRAQEELNRAPGTLAAAPLLLRTGHDDDAAALVPKLRAMGREGEIAAAEILFAVVDYHRLAPVVDTLRARYPDDPDARRLVYRWWFTVDDLASADAAIQARMDAGATNEADRLAAASLRAKLLDYDGAQEGYEKALAAALTPADSARAYQGLGETAYRKRDFDGSLERLTRALALSDPDPDLLESLSETLIRLGRTDEAIDADELAVRIAPYHERAHYMLGNGYARKNYSQLFAAYPKAFAWGPGAAGMARADSLLALGRVPDALRGYDALHRAYPEWVDVMVRLGSLEWDRGNYEAARGWFVKALDVCPEYGRAHNGLAKALEAERLAVEVHLPEYEKAFAAAPMPDVPKIETFVTNWNSLSPRHQKRVALSIAPWKRFIPVLIEAGETYYIKPLYELLSETPGQETLRDQRISYDSRLWDDVRGCGGYHTVTGVEDVERTIHDRYNTVLHELTHQVHGVLPAERKRQIQELYRETKERDEKTGDAFLSRYASGSVWEYFAEGANSLESPRRDRYDTREIVRERLEEKDPALMALVQEFMTTADVESCYAVGYANRGDDALERGRPSEAIASYEKALERSPGEESATGSLIYALTVADNAGKAVEVAEKATAKDPESASLAVRRADAMRHAGENLDAVVTALAAARPGVREEERYQVDLALGGYRWAEGDADGALAAYDSVLAYQSDSPEGLWGTATAHALAGEWDAAWKRYDEAVRLRTGVIPLRDDYARDLLRAGEIERAEEQVKEALLLDPEDPTSLALEGWVALARGDADRAVAAADSALGFGPWCDLATIIKARALMAGGKSAEASKILAPIRERLKTGAPPEYVYRTKWGRYDEVHALPAVERALIPQAK